MKLSLIVQHPSGCALCTQYRGKSVYFLSKKLNKPGKPREKRLYRATNDWNLLYYIFFSLILFYKTFDESSSLPFRLDNASCPMQKLEKHYPALKSLGPNPVNYQVRAPKALIKCAHLKSAGTVCEAIEAFQPRIFSGPCSTLQAIRFPLGAQGLLVWDVFNLL